MVATLSEVLFTDHNWLSPEQAAEQIVMKQKSSIKIEDIGDLDLHIYHTITELVSIADYDAVFASYRN